jgi:hypothetical protein
LSGSAPCTKTYMGRMARLRRRDGPSANRDRIPILLPQPSRNQIYRTLCTCLSGITWHDDEGSK